MTTPALQQLRKRFPRAYIAILTFQPLADLWRGHPAIDAVLTFERGQNPWSIAQRVRSEGFDVALILPNSARSGLECWLAGIPRRIGYAGHWRQWFLTDRLHHPGMQRRPRKLKAREVRQIVSNHQTSGTQNTIHYEHQIHDYLRLTAALGCDSSPLLPKLNVDPDETRSAIESLNDSLKTKGLAQASVFLGLSAGAAYGPAKRWPEDRFAAVVRQVAAELPGSVWLNFGTGADWDVGERIAGLAGTPIVNLAGKTSLRQLMAFLHGCRVLLTNDSGPMHVAAALGTFVVVPFGSTSPELTGPGLPGDQPPHHHLLQAHVPCAPCFRRTCPIDFRCMTGISVERVTAAVISLSTRKAC